MKGYQVLKHSAGCRDTSVSRRANLVPRLALLHNATSSLARRDLGVRNSRAVLTLTEGHASTARSELRASIEALLLRGAFRAGDGAGLVGVGAEVRALLDGGVALAAVGAGSV